MYKLFLFLSFIFTVCIGCKKNDKLVGANYFRIPQSNKILKNYIKSGRINGHVGENFYQNTKSDSLIFLHVSEPNEQNYPIDSIYFLHYDSSNFKLLAQSEFEKGLIYLEVDKNGTYKKYYSFGGYVLNVNNDIWPSTMPDTIKQFIKIESNKKSIDFKIWNKFEEKGVWRIISLD
jgi:hypothetical protein